MSGGSDTGGLGGGGGGGRKWPGGGDPSFVLVKIAVLEGPGPAVGAWSGKPKSPPHHLPGPFWSSLRHAYR